MSLGHTRSTLRVLLCVLRVLRLKPFKRTTGA